ncbi:hypothetical protein [Streptomyces sp. S.PB5]|uniref:hypothetical protein n=1 Tax=Streptomyces sp. S.PB5 TaxID=3020844 RepID=UPI0025AFCCD1|nr:hypothetical protein [Streptomyces sp. S.PB5]MDN3028541.1 hypothetical protein [Streptomyces sp. S.PB5]
MNDPRRPPQLSQWAAIAGDGQQPTPVQEFAARHPLLPALCADTPSAVVLTMAAFFALVDFLSVRALQRDPVRVGEFARHLLEQASAQVA